MEDVMLILLSIGIIGGFAYLVVQQEIDEQTNNVPNYMNREVYEEYDNVLPTDYYMMGKPGEWRTYEKGKES